MRLSIVLVALVAILLCAGPPGVLPSARAQKSKDKAEWTSEDTALAEQYIHLLETQPEYSRVFDLLWEHYSRHGASKLLMEFYRERIGATDASAGTRLIYAHLLRKKGESEKALRYYREVYDTAPPAERVLALRGLAELTRQMLRHEEAIGHFEQLIREPGAGPKVTRQSLESLGELYLEENEAEKALESWKRLLAEFPEDLALREGLAARMMAAGFPEDAIAAYESLRGQSGTESRVVVLRELSRLYEYAGRFSKAAAALEEGRNLTHFRHHTHADFLSMLVRLYERQGKLRELEKQFRNEAGGESPSESALYTLVRYYDLTAAPLKREEWLRRLVETAPRRSDYRRELVEVMLTNDHYEESKRVVQDLLAEGVEETLDLGILRARIALNLEGPEAAAALLREFIKRRPLGERDTAALLAFAQEHYLDEIAEELLREGTEGMTEAAVFDLANLHFSRGRLAETRTVLEDFVAAAGDDEKLKAQRLQMVASALRGMRLLEGAVEMLRRAIALRPGEIDYHVRLSELQAEMEEFDAALANYETAWQLSRTSEERRDIDQRIFSLLQLGDIQEGNRRPQELDLLSQPGKTPNTYPPFTRGAAEIRRLLIRSVGDSRTGGRLARYYEALQVSARDQGDEKTQLRAAWWAYRVEDYSTAYKILEAFCEARPSHVAAQRLLLDVALASSNTLRALKLLDTLEDLDPNRTTEYALRRAHIRLSLKHEDEALEAFEELLAQGEVTPEFLEDLAKIYEKLQRPGDALRIYREAYKKSGLFEKRRLIAELGRLQVRTGDVEGALEAYTALIRAEQDVMQRRKQLSSQVAIALRAQKLDKLEKDYTRLQRRQPLDPFYAEALAVVYQHTGNFTEAFALIKRAYYSSRSKDEYLLERLRELAAETKDVDAAIYYQKQLVAVPDNRADPGEWQKLVRMLEMDFQVDEADRIRVRLESKFAQDPDVLNNLTSYYLDTRQPASAKRVLQRMTRLRSWDTASLLRLAVLQRHLGNEDAACRLLYQVLRKTQEEALKSADDDGIGVFPLRSFSRDQRPELLGKSQGLEGLAQVLEHVRVLDNRYRVPLVRYLESPRQEFRCVPDEAAFQRLRAIEELGEIVATSAEIGRIDEWKRFWEAEPPVSIQEDFWRSWCSGAYGRAWNLLKADIAYREESALDEAREFFYCLFGAHMHRMDELVAWVGHPARSESARARRLQWLLTAVYQCSRQPETVLPSPELGLLLGSGLVQRGEVRHLLSLLTFSQQVPEALRFGELARKHGNMLADADDYFLANLAYRVGETHQQKSYLESALEAMDPGDMQFQDAVYSLFLLQEDDDARHKLILGVLPRLALATPSPRVELTRARLLALTGDDEEASSALRNLISMHMAESSQKVTLTMNSEGSAWPGLLEYSELSRHLGLANQARQPFLEALGKYELLTPIPGNAGSQFYDYLHQVILWEMENLSFPRRRSLLRSYGTLIRGEKELVNLARALSAQNFHRDSIAVYRELLDTNPRDNDYTRAFFNACQLSNDYEPALEYLGEIFAGDHPEPEGVTGDSMLRKHAFFLASARDMERLKASADLHLREGANVSPENYYYHHELAALFSEEGDHESAAAVYESIDDGKHQYVPLLRRHAAELGKLGQKEAAIALLRRIEFTKRSVALEKAVIEDLAPLYSATGALSPLRRLAMRTLDYDDEYLVIKLAEVMAKAGVRQEAESLLVLAAHQSKNDAARVRLLLPALRIRKAAGESFQEIQPLLEMLFTCDFTATGRARAALIEFARGFADDGKGQGWLRFLQKQESTEWNSPFAAVCRLDFELARGRAQGLTPIVESIVQASDSSSAMLDLAMESCLHHGAPESAGGLVAEARRRRGDVLAEVPLAIRVHAARGDDAALANLYQEVLGDRFAPAELYPKIPAAFAEAGDTRRALQVYAHYYKNIVRPGKNDLEFVAAYVRTLIEEDRFPEAEAILRKMFSKNIDFEEGFLVQLYRAWGKSETLQMELKKFHLSSGALKRVAVLAKRGEVSADATESR